MGYKNLLKQQVSQLTEMPTLVLAVDQYSWMMSGVVQVLINY